MQIPEEDYTKEKAIALKKKYWGEPDPDNIFLIEGVDDVVFEEDSEDEKEPE